MLFDSSPLPRVAVNDEVVVGRGSDRLRFQLEGEPRLRRNTGQGFYLLLRINHGFGSLLVASSLETYT